MASAVFLDKDGTLIPDIPYNVSPELITLSEDSVEGLKRLQDVGFLLIVVSNQSGVARGFFNENDLDAVKIKLGDLLKQHDIKLNGFYYCPHHPDGIIKEYAINCECRKPSAGMLFKAAIDLSINLADSWMVGDILNDVEAGNRAGCKSVLINNGNETEWLNGSFRTPELTCNTINAAADLILNSISHGMA